MPEFAVLLVSDLVDSAAVAEQAGMTATAALVQAHDLAARGLIQTWNGREIDKSDGFLVMFPTIDDALGFAKGYHKTLSELPIPMLARVGVHAGVFEVRRNPPEHVSAGAKSLEVDGIAKVVASRVMAVAAGGQTLLTSQALELLSPDAAIQFHTCGHWKLKGLRDPYELYEVLTPAGALGRPSDAEKGFQVSMQDGLWIPTRITPNSLPADRDAFIGRNVFLHTLESKFQDGARLVSIVGTGGIGKTRLGLRFGRSALGVFPGGVWFCDLSQARSLDGIAFAVAKGVDVPLGEGDPLLQLTNTIARRGRCLLLLDNFEQIASFAEETVGRWLDACPDARILVTSRTVLGISGEDVLTLLPMDRSEALELFRQRASAAGAALQPDGGENAQISDLVNLLDRLPLAIELASARARIMPVGVLAEKMGSRLDITSRGRLSGHRQSTLRATLDWSWNLLDSSERGALATLSVFRSGFTLEAARAVLANASELATAEVVQSLFESSLIYRQGERRFALLLGVQEYATERLSNDEGRVDVSVASRDVAIRRHFSYFAAFDEARAISDRCADAENLIVACERALERLDADAVRGTLLGAWAVLALRGPYRAAVELAGKVIANGELGSRARACAAFVAGSAQFMLGRSAEANHSLDSGLSVLQTKQDDGVRARLLCARGDLFTKLGRLGEADSDLTDALSIAGNDPDVAVYCRALNGLCAVAIESGRLADGRNHCERALSVARKANDKRWIGGLLGNLAYLDYCERHLESAVSRYSEALQIAEACGDRRWEGNARCNLGLLLSDQRRWTDAQLQLEAAVDIARGIGHARLEYTALCNLGIVAEAQQDLKNASLYFKQSIDLAHEMGDLRAEVEHRRLLAAFLMRRGDANGARMQLSAAIDVLKHSGDPVDLALSLCDLAEVEFSVGEAGRALSLRQQAEDCASVASHDTAKAADLWKRIAALRART